jgi:hypothetical protein
VVFGRLRNGLRLQILEFSFKIPLVLFELVDLPFSCAYERRNRRLQDNKLAKAESLSMREVSNENIQVIEAWKPSSHRAIIQHLSTANQTSSTLQEWRS